MNNPSTETLSPSLKELVETARSLYDDNNNLRVQQAQQPIVITVTAPGRVNLIGEHTDYTGGYVLPLAIEYSTVVVGSGKVINDASSKTRIRFVSAMKPTEIQDVTIDKTTSPPSIDSPDARSWTNYVVGTVAQYLPDLEDSSSLDLSFSIAGNVPLGSGLSSSASLEVAVARFVECILGEESAFSSSSSDPSQYPKLRALRCQAAENTWCHSPCGIMDQYVSSAASKDSLLLIDCRSLEYESVKLSNLNTPSIVVTNSNVQHSIGGGEYPVRVQQCKEATSLLQNLDASIESLRDATLQLVEQAKASMPDVIYRRAKHVVTENARTLECKTALTAGDWNKAGELMNMSHSSMKDDYEVSCKEIDLLVDLAQSFSGVYGSRLTGGGFGGCVVTLVEPSKAEALMEHLKKEYKSKTGLDCICFETSPGPGARVLSVEK